MASTLRAAIVGLGRIGCELHSSARPGAILNHAAALRGHPRIELVALCDASRVRLQACAERHPGIACYESLDRMLDREQPAIVSICTPAHTHADVAARILKSGAVRAVFIEKPLATDVESARHVLQLAAERGIVVAVNHTRRYVAALDALADEVSAGRIGAVQVVNGVYTGGIVNNGSHWFDLAARFAGPLMEVHAFPTPGGDADDPTPDVRLRFGSGARGLLCGVPAASYGIFEMQIIGERGRIHLQRSGREIAVYEARPSTDAAGFLALELVDTRTADLDAALPCAVSDLVAALDSGRPPRCDGEAALAALGACFAGKASLARGGPVRLGQSMQVNRP